MLSILQRWATEQATPAKRQYKQLLGLQRKANGVKRRHHGMCPHWKYREYRMNYRFSWTPEPPCLTCERLERERFEAFVSARRVKVAAQHVLRLRAVGRGAR